jgi:hypothetical protein
VNAHSGGQMNYQTITSMSTEQAIEIQGEAPQLTIASSVLPHLYARNFMPS